MRIQVKVRPRVHRKAALVAATVLAAYCLGFAAHKYPDYPVGAASGYAVNADRGGLQIGVEPVENLDAQKKYFNSDMISQGFMPVFVVIDNNSITDSFLFEKANIGYAHLNASSATNEVAKLKWFGGPSTVKSMEIQENLAKKQLKSKTLSPGTSVYGFLYIPLPKWNGPRQKIHLQVPLTKSGTNETYVLNLYF